MTEWTRMCVLCARRDKRTPLDSGYVCTDCTLGLQRSLNQLLDLATDAAECIYPSSSGTGRAPGFEGKVLLNVDAWDATKGGAFAPHFDGQPMPPTILETLESWERMIRESYGLSPYGVATEECATEYATLSHCATFLRRSLARLIYDPQFPFEDFADEIRECVSSVYRWNRERKTDNIWRVNCPADRESEGTCGREITITGQDVNARVQCRRCGSEWSVQWLMRVAATTADSHLWLDGEAICERLGVDKRTLARWVREGRTVKEHGLYDARPLFTATAKYTA